MDLLKESNYRKYLATQSGAFQRYISHELNDWGCRQIATSIYNTLSIEGNTITYEDTLKLLEGSLSKQEAILKYIEGDVLEVQELRETIYLVTSNYRNIHLTETLYWNYIKQYIG